MKTKILKFGMPLMAFLLAIVFAFASNGKPEMDDAIVPGYIFSNGTCELKANDCTVEGNTLCKIGGQQVYHAKEGNQCKNPLMRWN